MAEGVRAGSLYYDVQIRREHLKAAQAEAARVGKELDRALNAPTTTRRKGGAAKGLTDLQQQAKDASAELKRLADEEKAGAITRDEYRKSVDRLQAEMKGLTDQATRGSREYDTLTKALGRSETVLSRMEKQDTDQAIASINNEVFALRNQLEAGAVTEETFRRRMRELIDESNRMTQAMVDQHGELARGSREYRKASNAAGGAERALATLDGRVTKLGLSQQIAIGGSELLGEQLRSFGPAGDVAAGALRLLDQRADGLANTFGGRLPAALQNSLRLMSTLQIVAPFALGAAAVGLTRLANSAAETALEIDRGAQQTGLSIEAYQELAYAFEQAGIEQEDFLDITAELNQVMGEAARGEQRFIDQFSRLGIQIRTSTGEMRGTEDVLYDTIAALEAIPESSRRAGEAVEIFGDDVGRKLLTLVNQGADSLVTLREEARELGLVISGDSILSLVEYRNEMSTLQQQVKTARVEIAASFLPVLRDAVIPLLQDHVVPWVQNAAEGLDTLTTRFTETGEAGEVFRGQIADGIEPAVRLGNAIAGTGQSILGLAHLITGGLAGSGAAIGTFLAQIEQMINSVEGIQPAIKSGLRGQEMLLSGDLQGGYMEMARGALALGDADFGSIDWTLFDPEEIDAAAREAGEYWLNAGVNALSDANSRLVRAVDPDFEITFDALVDSLERDGERSLFGDGGGPPGDEESGAVGSLRRLQEDLADERETFEKATTDAAREASAERIRVLEEEIEEMQAVLEEEQATISSTANPFAAVYDSISRADPYGEAGRILREGTGGEWAPFELPSRVFERAAEREAERMQEARERAADRTRTFSWLDNLTRALDEGTGAGPVDFGIEDDLRAQARDGLLEGFDEAGRILRSGTRPTDVVPVDAFGITDLMLDGTTRSEKRRRELAAAGRRDELTMGFGRYDRLTSGEAGQGHEGFGLPPEMFEAAAAEAEQAETVLENYEEQLGQAAVTAAMFGEEEELAATRAELTRQAIETLIPIVGENDERVQALLDSWQGYADAAEEAEKETATLEDHLGNTADTLTSLGSAADGPLGDVLDGLGSAAEIAKDFASGDTLAAVTALGEEFVGAFTAASKATREAKAELDTYLSGVNLIDPDALTKEVTETVGWFLFIPIRATVEVPDEEIQPIAEKIQAGVTAGMQNARDVILAGGSREEVEEAIHDGLEQAVMDAILQGVIQGAVVEGALQDELGRITEAAAEGNWREVERRVAGLGDEVDRVADELYGVFESWADPAEGIADSLEAGVESGLSRGVRAYLESGNLADLESGIEQGLYDSVTTALVDALVQEGIIKGALGQIIPEIGEAFAAGDTQRAADLTQQVMDMVPGLAAQLAPILDPLRSLDPSDGSDGPGGSSGGIQVQEITGPTRNLFLDLFSPLASLDSLPGIASRTFDLLESRLPPASAWPVPDGPASLRAAPAAAPVITFEPGAIQIQNGPDGTDAGLGDDLADAFARGLRSRGY